MDVSYTGITRYMTLHKCRHVEPRTPNTKRAVYETPLQPSDLLTDSTCSPDAGPLSAVVVAEAHAACLGLGLGLGIGLGIG